MYRYTKIAVLAIVAVMAAAAYAARDDRQSNVDSIRHTNISLSQAVITAEQYAGGKAMRAAFRQGKGVGLYIVEVANGSTVIIVQVDANGGVVISSSERHGNEDIGDCKAQCLPQGKLIL